MPCNTGCLPPLVTETLSDRSAFSKPRPPRHLPCALQQLRGVQPGCQSEAPPLRNLPWAGTLLLSHTRERTSNIQHPEGQRKYLQHTPSTQFFLPVPCPPQNQDITIQDMIQGSSTSHTARFCFNTSAQTCPQKPRSLCAEPRHHHPGHDPGVSHLEHRLPGRLCPAAQLGAAGVQLLRGHRRCTHEDHTRHPVGGGTHTHFRRVCVVGDGSLVGVGV